MPRLTRPPRLASLCLLGTPATSTRDNAKRLMVLRELVGIMKPLAHWHRLDAIVLPGGFLRLSRALGRSSFDQRREQIAKEAFMPLLLEILSSLEELSPGIKVVIGTNATPRDGCHVERHDHSCLAFDATGLVAAARKLFQTRAEFRRRNRFSPFEADFSSTERFVHLSNGSVALLHAGYDLLGTADIGTGCSIRRKAIRLILRRRGCICGPGANFRILRDRCVRSWTELIDDMAPDVAMASIGSMSDGYSGPIGLANWQRLGVVGASAALNGALVVSAAHISSGAITPQAPLAACRVQPRHQRCASNRAADLLAPITALSFESSGGLSAVVRLFEARRRTPVASFNKDSDWPRPEVGHPSTYPRVDTRDT